MTNDEKTIDGGTASIFDVVDILHSSRLMTQFLSRVSDIAVLSVRPSVTFGIVSKRLNISSQFLHRTVAQSLTSIKHLREIPTGSPACGGTKYRWGIKILRFSTNNSIAISHKRYKTAPLLLWNANRNSHAIYRMMYFQ